MNAHRVIRPRAVLIGQLAAFWWGLKAPFFGDFKRIVTYSEQRGSVLGLPWRTHVVQISTEDGAFVFYRTPHMTNAQRSNFIRRIERIRNFYLTREARQ